MSSTNVMGRVRLAGSGRPAARRTPGRRWWADLAGSAALLSVVAVVALWLHDGGIRAFAQPGGPATTAGRLTGLVASDLLLLQVLLMARIPGVERGYGQDTLARRHRVVGFVSFWLMIGHLTLITVGYAQSGGAGVVAEAWDLVVTYPGMLLAAAGTGLLFLVVVLSVRLARRRQRYETWHLIHLYAYLGVGLALPHQLWTGADFVASAPARIYWWGLYAATLGAVVVFRVGLPVYRSAYHRLRVHAVVPEAPGVVSVYLRGHRLDRLPARGGQFFLWRFLDGPGWTRAHPYTLSSAPSGDLLRITVKELGDGSSRVATLRPGTRVLVEGPYGALTADRRAAGRKVLLVAAGVGITTMRALLDDFARSGAQVTLLYRIRRPADAVFRTELDEAARRGLARVIYLDGGRARAGSWLPAQFARVGDLAGLRRLVPDVAQHDAFVCGPPPWMAGVRTTLRAAGVDPDHIHAEEFAW
ncbi:ferric reductase-like transmembrane domain-containing protein [Paractinoplanes ferrugineus]|uniref:Oxidoreductase n=1 Tax=Paractinoplanes ferrugineus TaxID=113564 RepID=A0A919MF06_9ACTN|nr:ferredoxin reductase family protein [Actinoplanes ferrugineus]GIE13308.1 oxidoreductase [Actinoplanes ferrugineus]